MALCSRCMDGTLAVGLFDNYTKHLARASRFFCLHCCLCGAIQHLCGCGALRYRKEGDGWKNPHRFVLKMCKECKLNDVSIAVVPAKSERRSQLFGPSELADPQRKSKESNFQFNCIIITADFTYRVPPPLLSIVWLIPLMSSFALCHAAGEEKSQRPEREIVNWVWGVCCCWHSISESRNVNAVQRKHRVHRRNWMLRR